MVVPPVDLYLDYACPWSYLALIRLSETALRTGARICFRPIVLEDVKRSAQPPLAGTRTASHPARRRYQNKDLDDWARYCGVILKPPADWPAASGPAARAALAADDQGRCAAYSRELYQAFFTTGENIQDPCVLARAAIRAGLDTHRFAETLAGDGVAARLAHNCKDLLQRGGFGAPTMFVNDDMFFGHERIPLVEFAIGQASGRRFVAPGDHHP